jgi:hypothetical protein
MSIPYPSDFEIDHEADRQWQRAQAALRTLEIGDVLAEVDDLIAQEPDPAKHPLYSLVAHALDRTTMAGTGTALQLRYAKLVDYAIERLVEQKLADVSAWED